MILFFLAHTCSFPGCGSVLVLDGNMKNHRDVCYAKDAGFIQFDGLPGLIKTGCPASPDYKSQYCAQHKNHACALPTYEEVDDELGTTPGPALRSQTTIATEKATSWKPYCRDDLSKEDNQETDILPGVQCNQHPLSIAINILSCLVTGPVAGSTSVQSNMGTSFLSSTRFNGRL